MGTSFLFGQIAHSSSGLASIRTARWTSQFSWRKESEQTLFFLKIHSASTVAPTENLPEYKLVERKMAHLFYLVKLYIALLVQPPYGPQSGHND